MMYPLVWLTAGSVLAAAWASALAQGPPPGRPIPDLQNRIPAPLPPPPQPPVINGPLSQRPPPAVYLPPRLTTPSDRTRACLQEGSDHGLRGGELDAYARSCANEN
jgi:hypothetical protein